MGALNSTSPIQNSVGSPTSPSDINDSKISAETTPKPRKFFKSRNAAPPAEIQQQIAIQQQMAMQQQMSQHHNHVQSSPEEQPVRTSPKKQKKQAAPKKEKIVKPKVEKPPKVKKVKAPKIKEIVAMPEAASSDSDDEVLSPPRRGRQANNDSTRHSGRVRGRLINYNEDEGEEEFIMRTEKRIAPKQLKLLQKQQQQQLLLEQQQQQEQEQLEETIPITFPMETQNHSEASPSPAINHPPIVLRISKVSAKK